MQETTKITFLGTGTSQGVPVISCNCEVCTSSDKRDVRLRSSVLFEVKNKQIVIDTGPDFRQQMLRNKVHDITAVLFTHEHKDHVAGLDDVRPFNHIHNKAIEVYAEKRVEDALKREYAYIFAKNKYPGIPQINMNLISETPFFVEGLEIIPIRAFHHKLPILGYRIGDVCYLTDIKTISDVELLKLKGLKVLIVNALQKTEHVSHMNLNEALKLIDRVTPDRAYLTHLNHRFGLHSMEEANLPDNIYIAYDNLILEV